MWVHCDCYYRSVWQGLSQMMVIFYWSTIDCKALMRVFAHWVLAGLHWLLIVKTWKLTMTCRRNFLKVIISQKDILTCPYVCTPFWIEAVFDAEDLQEGTEEFPLESSPWPLKTNLTLSRSVKWTSKSPSETRKLKESGMGTDWETRKSSGFFWISLRHFCTMVIKFQGAWNAAWNPPKSRWSEVRFSECFAIETWHDLTIWLCLRPPRDSWGSEASTWCSDKDRSLFWHLLFNLAVLGIGSSIKVERYNHVWFWLKLQAARTTNSCEQRLVNQGPIPNISTALSTRFVSYYMCVSASGRAVWRFG